MEYLKDVLAFLWAVINNWAGYVTGGVVVALLWLWSTFRQIPISRKIGIVTAIVFLFFAFFNAWREQYLKTKIGLTMEINYGGPTDPLPGYLGTPVLIWATMANRGAPTVADNWELRVTTADGRATKKGGVPIIVMDKPFILEGKYRIEPSQALYEQTKTPIPSGAKPKGVLAFMVSEIDRNALRSKGTTFIVSCKDIFGNTIEASLTMTGVKMSGPPYLLGMPMEEVPQQQQPEQKDGPK